MPASVRVIKLGGSLLDLPDLVQRVQSVVHGCEEKSILLVVGGAEAADIVRRFDAAFRLGETKSHWLAVRAMQFNAYCVRELLPDVKIVRDCAQCEQVWRQSRVAIVDPLAWLEADEQRGVGIPHRWSFTSDSIAANLAVQLDAGQLTLLKSTLPACDGLQKSENFDAVADAAAKGIVDADFPATAATIRHIDIIDLRHPSLAQGRVDAVALCRLRGEP